MTALVEHHLDLPGARSCTVRMERADRSDPQLAEALVEIDLQSFVETTYSRYTAQALLQHGEVLLLRADGRIIGAAVVVRSWDPPHEALLLSMAILPGWRGRGLGQRFVGWVLEALASEGISAVTLLVGSDNTRAMRVYRDVGFEVVREVEVEAGTGTRQLLLRVRLDSWGGTVPGGVEHV
ncbi:MAG: GNAT family N-acetyltransferase [Alphaproteobacteria bacterium]|nr:GNAT family N-acetyltransferase [Alphaproteobacteria bacterium]